MSDSIKGLIITFDEDIKDYDLERYIELLYSLRYVANVQKSVANHDDRMNRERVRMELKKELWEVLEDG